MCAIKKELIKIALNNEKLSEFWYSTYNFEGDINDLLADELIKNNKILSYIKNNETESLDFIKTNIEDKLKKLKEAANEQKKGYVKNDGIYMNFLSYEALKEFLGLSPLYLLQLSDIDSPKFGVDSVFYKDDNIWIFEYKTSILELKEKDTAIKIREGVESLFCKGDMKTAAIYECRTNVRDNKLNPNLLEITQSIIDNRGDTESLLKIPKLTFNVCIVSPSGVFSEEEIKKYIIEEYLECDNCEGKGGVCKKFKCPRFSKIKIFNAFHVQLPTEFSLPELYEAIIKKLKEKTNA